MDSDLPRFQPIILEGTRVMCDSNRVKGTVKQYLVTEDNDIVVNDLGTF